LTSRPAAPAVRSIIRAKPAVVNGDPRSLTKTKGDAELSRWSRRRAAQLIADQRVRGRDPILDPPHVQDGGIEFDLVPTQVAQLGCP
jgi:hypothetical protein